MKSLFVSVEFVFIITCCAHAQSKRVSIPLGNKSNKSSNESVAYFAEGCFWHSEIVFQSLAGVRDAVSGYSGGTAKNPDYELVSSGETGHAETMAVYYNPAVINYAGLVDAFFASQNPTELNRQGNDEGTQYRSAAFYSNDSEKQILETAIINLTAAKKYQHPIVTEIIPFKKFYPAEAYHQEFIYHNPGNEYVKNVSIPDFVQFKNSFKGNFK